MIRLYATAWSEEKGEVETAKALRQARAALGMNDAAISRAVREVFRPLRDDGRALIGATDDPEALNRATDLLMEAGVLFEVEAAEDGENPEPQPEGEAEDVEFEAAYPAARSALVVLAHVKGDVTQAMVMCRSLARAAADEDGPDPLWVEALSMLVQTFPPPPGHPFHVPGT